MADFMVNLNSSGILTLIKPLGKPLSLKVGELVKANILDILPSGAVVLKIKGFAITAMPDMPIKTNTDAFFKVIVTNKEGTELRLQFIGYAEDEKNLQRIISPDNGNKVKNIFCF